MNFDFDKLSKKYDLLWKKENHERPLITMFAPRKDICWDTFPSEPDSPSDKWLDPEYGIKRHRFYMENTTIYLGEAFPQTWTNFGPDIMGAICGCDIEFGKDTSWAVHNVTDWCALKDIVLDKNNKWRKRLFDYTKTLVEDSKGEYIVGITDLHPGLDGLVSLRGPENLCLDIFDEPDAIKKFNFQISDVFKKVYEEQYNLVTKYLPYTTNWMNIFSNDREYVVSCDFSCLISKDNYEEFVIPELTNEIDFLDSAIYHLDGVQALTHLDRICAIDNLKGIQWVPGTGQKPMRAWLDVLKKIQKSGKIIDITVEPEDIKPLCENLNAEGVMMHTVVDSEEDGKSLIKMMEDIYKNK